MLSARSSATSVNLIVFVSYFTEGIASLPDTAHMRYSTLLSNIPLDFPGAIADAQATPDGSTTTAHTATRTIPNSHSNNKPVPTHQRRAAAGDAFAVGDLTAPVAVDGELAALSLGFAAFAVGEPVKGKMNPVHASVTRDANANLPTIRNSNSPVPGQSRTTRRKPPTRRVKWQECVTMLNAEVARDRQRH